MSEGILAPSICGMEVLKRIRVMKEWKSLLSGGFNFPGNWKSKEDRSIGDYYRWGLQVVDRSFAYYFMEYFQGTGRRDMGQ